MWQAPGVEELQAMLPQYEVLELIGRGGMGAVYKARQTSLRRLVAIKILPRDAADDEMRFAERFKNEAFAMARLNHPGIVNVHDAGETGGGLLYFVMEHVEGRDLAQEITECGRIPQDEVRLIAMQVCDALGYLHGNGMIHRDIKPANVLLTAQGRVKVADFGLARLDEPLVSTLLTREGTSMGTVEFMAPECKRAAAAADHRADLFSLGVVIYQMLTGELPHGMFKLPAQLLPEIDERFDDIICKALEPKPQDRYQSAKEMRDDLEAPAPAQPHPVAKSSWIKPMITGAIVLALTGIWIFLQNSGWSMGESRRGTGAGKMDAAVPNAVSSPWPWQSVDLASIKGLKSEGGRYLCTGYLLLEDLLKTHARNMAVKVTAAPAPGNFPLAIMLLTASGGQRYQGVIQTETIHGGISYWEASRASPEKLQDSTASRALVDGQTSHELEFRIIEGNLTLLQDGIVVATTSDTRLKEGGIAIQIGEGGVLSSIEYAILDGLSDEAKQSMINGKPAAQAEP